MTRPLSESLAFPRMDEHGFRVNWHELRTHSLGSVGEGLADIANLED